MIVLGIESSCDETAAALVKDGREELSSVIASQADLHSYFGGVVPEIASREHIKAITPVISEALGQAGLGIEEVDAIAVTYGPGLIGPLLVGTAAAKALAFASGKPLYAVHHIAGHVTANFLAHQELEPPFVCLVASGGHSHILLVEDYTRYRVLGRTRDDAAGEAFDKIARAIGLGYPGGPKIDREAQGGKADAVIFPKSKISGNDLDFSFSGLKTAALNFIQKLSQTAEKKGMETWELFSRKDFCASYQEAIVSTLVEHTVTATERLGLTKIAISGGVAANSALRRTFSEVCEARACSFYAPPLSLCTDNASMIASLGYFMAKAAFPTADLSLDAKPSLRIDDFSGVVSGTPVVLDASVMAGSDDEMLGEANS